MQVMVIGLGATMLIMALAPRLQSLQRQVQSTSEPIPVYSYLNSVVDLTKIALKEHWCLTPDWRRDTINCNLSHPRNTERMLLTSRFIDLYKRQTPTPPEPTLAPSNTITGSINVASVLQASTDPSNPNFHPLAFATQSLAREGNLQNAVIDVSITQIRHNALPSSGIGEHYFSIKAQVSSGFVARFLTVNSRPGVAATVGMYPKEVNSYALMVAGDFRLDLSRPSLDFDIALPRRSNNSGGVLTFNSPVFINKSLVLPRRPSTDDPDLEFTPVTFAAPVVMGQGPLKIAQPNNEPPAVFAPQSQGGIGNWYYNDLGLRFGGLTEGAVSEGRPDLGLTNLFRTYTDQEAQSRRLKFACINRNIYRSSTDFIRDSSLALRLTPGVAVNPTEPVNDQRTFHFDLGLTGGLNTVFAANPTANQNNQSIIGGNEFSEALASQFYASLLPLQDARSLTELLVYSAADRTNLFFSANQTYSLASAFVQPWITNTATHSTNRAVFNQFGYQVGRAQIKPFDHYFDPSCVGADQTALCDGGAQDKLFPNQDVRDVEGAPSATHPLYGAPANAALRFFFNHKVSTNANATGTQIWKRGLPELSNAGSSTAPVLKVFLKLGQDASPFTTIGLSGETAAVLSASMARGSVLRVPVNNVAYRKLKVLNNQWNPLQSSQSRLGTLRSALQSGDSAVTNFLVSRYNTAFTAITNARATLDSAQAARAACTTPPCNSQQNALNAAETNYSNQLNNFRNALLAKTCNVDQVTQANCGASITNAFFTNPLNCSDQISSDAVRVPPSGLQATIPEIIDAGQSTQACVLSTADARLNNVATEMSSIQHERNLYMAMKDQQAEIIIRVSEKVIAGTADNVPFTNPEGQALGASSPVNNLPNVQKDRLKLEVSFVGEAAIYASIREMLIRNGAPNDVSPTIHVDFEPFDLNSDGTYGNNRESRTSTPRLSRLTFVESHCNRSGTPVTNCPSIVSAPNLDYFRFVSKQSFTSNDWRITANNVNLSFEQIYQNREVPLLEKQYLADNFDSTSWERACTSATSDMTQSQALAPWSHSFAQEARESWFFAVDPMILASPGVSWPGKPFVPPAASTRNNPGNNPISTVFTNATDNDFSVSAISGECIVEETASFVTGFYVCDRLVIRNRSQPLTVVGTFITGDLDIASTALNAGIKWYSITHSNARKILFERGVLTNGTGPCIEGVTPTFDTPVWTPRVDATRTIAMNSCSTAGLRFRANPFMWTSVDPDCGLIPGQPNNSCHYRSGKHTAVEFARESNQ
jgi:hypothetical protein